MTRLIISLFLLGLASVSQATVIYNMSGGKLSNIQNIDINGSLYDVTFQNGSFNSIFVTNANLAFSSQAEANNASSILLTHLQDGIAASDGLTYNFDTNNSLVNGCVNYIWCDILTPYQEYVNSSGVEMASSVAARNFYDTSSDFVLSISLRSDFNTNNSTVPFWYTYANWNLSSPVPEPPTLFLMALGVLGLSFMNRRQNRG